jgi:hypothetical protein
MNTKHKSSRKPNHHLGKIKLGITAGALTLTLGFWTLFSNQASQQVLAQAEPDPQIAVNPDGQLVLLPMPTLVPQASSGAQANPLAENSTNNSLVSQLEQQFKLLLGSSQPSQVVQPRTITRTRSSR